MRGLAEFVMKGRKQAILAVVLTGAIPLVYFISPVIVGLVILRHGMKEASVVLVWALLPLAAWVLFPGLLWEAQGNLLSIGLLLAVSALALVLRSSAGSWQLTVLAGVAVGLAFELYLRLQPYTVDLLLAQITPMLEQNPAGATVARSEVVALIAWMHAAMALLLLMWSRWMQAMLYNPGGFRAEFHALRIERKMALPLAVAMLLAGTGVVLPDTWLLYFAMPLLFAGTALVHATIALKQLSAFWLLAFYAVFPVIVQFLVLVALTDSWFDFRKNMRRPA